MLRSATTQKAPSLLANSTLYEKTLLHIESNLSLIDFQALFLVLPPGATKASCNILHHATSNILILKYFASLSIFSNSCCRRVFFLFNFCHLILFARHISFSQCSSCFKMRYLDVSMMPQLWSPSTRTCRIWITGFLQQSLLTEINACSHSSPTRSSGSRPLIPYGTEVQGSLRFVQLVEAAL